jgi:hypothetical protein
MTAFPRPLRRRASRSALRTATGFALLATAAGATACGGERAEVTDASDGRPFAVSAKATFARSQRLANVEELRITVKNEDSRALPDVAVVLKGLDRRIPVTDNGAGRVADPRRPVWVVDAPPAGGTTAYVGTSALGRLAPGATKTFTWQLTPTVAGKHRLTWRIAAALDQDGPVKAASGSRTRGSFAVDVAD